MMKGAANAFEGHISCKTGQRLFTSASLLKFRTNNMNKGSILKYVSLKFH